VRQQARLACGARAREARTGCAEPKPSSCSCVLQRGSCVAQGSTVQGRPRGYVPLRRLRRAGPPAPRVCRRRRPNPSCTPPALARRRVLPVATRSPAMNLSSAWQRGTRPSSSRAIAPSTHSPAGRRSCAMPRVCAGGRGGGRSGGGRGGEGALAGARTRGGALLRGSWQRAGCVSAGWGRGEGASALPCDTRRRVVEGSSQPQPSPRPLAAPTDMLGAAGAARRC
jgi:hypothetical protein